MRLFSGQKCGCTLAHGQFVQFLSFYLFIYDFLGCGCGSCFVLFCLIGHDFHFLINWVIDFFFFLVVCYFFVLF